MLTTTEPIRGRTYDDGIEMPAVHVLYEATKGTGKKIVPFRGRTFLLLLMDF
jgi:hypothetical protein